MAVDKLVDSTQLDADLTSVANAIRTKGGTSAQMAFPAGFVSAVQAIPTGTTPTGTKQISITANGTTTEDVAAYANAEITVNVQGGGGSSNWTLLGTQEFTVNTTTTSNKAVGTFTVSGISASKYIFVRIRDKAGKRNGYFYGTDSIGSLYNTVVQTQTVVTHVDSQGNYIGYPNKAGLFPYSFQSDGQIAIYSKYNSSNTGTIDGTYVVEVYALEPPTGKPIFT